MKQLVVIGSLFFAFNSFAIDCSTVGISSCTNTEGMCLEYAEFTSMPEAQLKSICKSMNGEYKNAPCDSSFNKGTCINENNPMMQIIRYNDLLDTDSAKMFCEMAGGMMCE